MKMTIVIITGRFEVGFTIKSRYHLISFVNVSEFSFFSVSLDVFTLEVCEYSSICLIIICEFGIIGE
jgi:hypothetical protein